MEETKETKVTDAELWELRAIQWGLRSMELEIQLSKSKMKELDKDMKDLLARLMDKYGDVQVDPDGKLIYPKEQ